MNKKTQVALVVLAVLAVFSLTACGSTFEVGQVVVAQKGVHLYSDLNDFMWFDTCALGTRDNEAFIVEEVSTYGQDNLPVYLLRSIDRTKTDLLWGCEGWTDPNDVGKFGPYGK